MKARTVGILAVGAAIGYVLNTDKGREKLAQLKGAGQGYLGRPEVQAKTHDLADKAKQRTASLPHSVQNLANQTIERAERVTSRAAGNGEAPAAS